MMPSRCVEPRSRTPLRCLKNTGTERADDASVDADDARERRERKVLRCSACDTEIADHEAIFGFGGKSPVQVHTNPAGLIFEILTLTAARNLAHVTKPSTVFTWFPGYAWEIVCCGSCSMHLGWHFTATGSEGSPRAFYGLLRKRLR